MKHLLESLLDDEDDLIKNTEKNIYVKKIFKYFTDYGLSDSKNCDYFGRPINIGDVMLYSPSGSFFEIGIVKHIKESFIIFEDKPDDHIYSPDCIIIPKECLQNFYKIITKKN